MKMNDLPPPPGPRRSSRMPPQRVPTFQQLKPGAQIIGALAFVLTVLLLVLAITGTGALIMHIIREVM